MIPKSPPTSKSHMTVRVMEDCFTFATTSVLHQYKMLIDNSTLFPEMSVNMNLACSFIFEDVPMNIVYRKMLSVYS